MSQSYFPYTPQQTAADSHHVELTESHLNDAQQTYLEHKHRLVNALDASKTILSDIRAFNKDSWPVRYPQFRDTADSSVPPSTPAPRRKGIRRSLTFADEPQVETEVVITPSGDTSTLTVSNLGNLTEEPESEEDANGAEDERLIPPSDVPDEFQVFRLDLSLGRHGSAASATKLVSQLERSSIANLLDDRLSSSIQHVDKLRVRVEDTSSKVLVTGDLNAGKSTFVNALLERDIMPVDQQPCTTAFCEVHDCSENDGVEEVHIVKDRASYNVRDESTFVRVPLEELEHVNDDNECTDLVLKLYLEDAREPGVSFLNNGIADISLIDAPGLNRDSFKTTAVFARQEEIDVVVFVVSAENHFTLSGKEFLAAASNEKAYIFIVVNKFDQIRNKDKCRRLVLEQIKEFSPQTYAEADDLVHFVDSASGVHSPAFESLQSALRSFVCVKRTKSKLHPATTYLKNLLYDVDLLAGTNRLVAQADLARAHAELDRVRPVLEKLQGSREELEETLENVEEENGRVASNRMADVLSDALDRVAQGLPAIENISLPSYPGILNLWDYISDVRSALLASIDAAVRSAEDDARVTTKAGVENIIALAEQHLPPDFERFNRVFIPEAMFSPNRRYNRFGSARIGGNAIAGGVMGGLGLALAQRSDLLTPSFGDLFDANHFFILYFAGKNADSEDDADGMELSAEVASPTVLGVFGVGLGALTMVGGQAVGARALLEGAVRISDMLGNESARKWAAPVLGALALGAVAYFVTELPSAVPRTVGRRLRRELILASTRPAEAGEKRRTRRRRDEEFVRHHAERVGYETRKVIKLAAWDLRQRFRAAMEDNAREVRNAEEEAKVAATAEAWFEEVVRRTGAVRVGAGLGLGRVF